ncbi:MAG TPA: DUF2336 domain-containing protein [Xanthobacteraceae bacterium]|nr:DUF2336 domain-containing protein [Xanthobacteraceae bacterium]
MIIRRFLHWVRTASAGERAEATRALARAYLYSDLSPDDRAAAESAMITLLDDPSPLVRRALAEGLAASPDAPHAVIHALASDHCDVAAIVLARSPLLIDADLVDLVATRNGTLQAAIAARAPLQRAVAAAVAEVGSAEACLVAIENPCADVAPSSIARIIDRFGHLGAIRESLFARPDLPLAARQSLVRQLSGALARFVADRAWLERDRAEEVGREACEKATIAIAALRPGDDTRALIRHLRESGQLTAGLMLRALLSGNMAMFEDTLAELTGLPLRRVQALVHDRGNAGFRAVFDKAGLPASTYVGFREALSAAREAHHNGEIFGMSRLKRRMVERALTSCERCDLGDIEPLMILLRRFATEAAREDARINCKQLVAEGRIEHDLAAA